VQDGDIVLVPIIFTDGSGLKKRPAVVVQSDLPGSKLDCWVVAITSRQQASDWHIVHVPTHQFQSFGLIAESWIQCGKIMTVDKTAVVRVLGKVDSPTLARVKAIVASIFAGLTCPST
jgi:mRNA-degrading endonuclease toxin of MazEF toxin-antitoxin module